MIYLLYGSDFERVKKKAEEIATEFGKKNGDLNIHKFDAEESDLKKLKDTIDTRSLFALKKLLIIKYLSRSYERVALLKVLVGARDDIAVIIEHELSAGDLAALKPACDKVQEFALAPGVKISKTGSSVFELGDTFFSDQKQGLHNLLELLGDGHDEMGIFSYLTNHARTLLAVKICQERKKSLPKEYKIHPFVAQKAGAIARRVSVPSLQNSLCRFFQEDVKIKTGAGKAGDSLVDLVLEDK